METATALHTFVQRAVVVTLLLLLTAPVRTPAQDRSQTVLVLGDSLSAAYGMPTSSGWVMLLQQRLQEQRHDYRVVNASINGETTRRGLTRLPDLITAHRPDIVVVELGANDGLRQQSLEQMKKNLSIMVEHARIRGVRVLLVGVRLPLTYDRSYAEEFKRVYRDVAAEQNVAFVPFILEGVADNDSLFQRDRVHPNEDAQPVLLENVWGQLKPMLARSRDQAAVNAPR